MLLVGLRRLEGSFKVERAIFYSLIDIFQHCMRAGHATLLAVPLLDDHPTLMLHQPASPGIGYTDASPFGS